MPIKIVLVSPRNPLNIGAAARAMGNFALSELRVVNPYTPTWDEAVTAVGAHDILKQAKVYQTLPQAIADCNLVLATTSLKNRVAAQKVVALPDINNFLLPYNSLNIAIIFGQEKTGLSAAQIAMAHAILNIPTTAKVPSINLAQAVVLCCYELSKTTIKAKYIKSDLNPTVKEYDLVEKQLVDLFDKLALPPTVNAKIRAQKLRELTAKMALNKQNLFFINTIIKQITKKLNKEI